ncbi:MAG: DUF4907 domain-containing protein [Winogradskyella sp.]
MKNLLKYVVVFFIIVISVFTITHFISQQDESVKQSNNNITLHISKQENYWIYEIKRNDQLFIRQEYIPAVSGKQRFKTKKEVEIIGEIVLEKLSNRMNPTITIDDLKTNGITFKEL